MPEHTIAENLARLQAAKTAIGNAIVAKGGTVNSGDGLEEYPTDIASIETAELTSISITANGVYDTGSTTSGYNHVDVNVPNTYSSSDEGKVVSNGQLIPQIAKPDTIITNNTYDTTNYNSVTVDVENSYTASDEGKVVNNGELTAQTAKPDTITTNSTYDTTLYSSVTVNVENSYSASDEGKVVSNGSLVAQTAKPTEITANDTYDTTMYNSVTVDVANTYTQSDEGKVVSNGELVAQTAKPDVVVENGVYNTTLYNSVNVSVLPEPQERKDVNFYDYDGTIIKRYTAAEFANISELPDNPYHAGLTAQGWNWSLSDAKAYVAKYGKLEIGQMYITDDGKTRIYITLTEGRISPILQLYLNAYSELDIDWGDGSTHSTFTTINAEYKSERHNYATAGDYVIAITVITGSFVLRSSSNNVSSLLWNGNNSGGTPDVAYNNSIKKVEIGASMTSIGANAFCYCSSLSSITIPNGVTSISINAFRNCYSLTFITIPNTITGDIGGFIFQDCRSLSSITIPNTVTSIGDSAFSDCYSLSSITIPDSVTSIGNYAFQYCYSLSSFTIPDSVTTIGAFSFRYCYSLSSIAIPNEVTTISDQTFNGCSSLSSITIPDKVTSIGTFSFSSCSSLASVTIGTRVTTIITYAFSGCRYLESIKFKPTTPPSVSNSNTWSGVPTTCVIYVPTGTLNAYKTATNYPNPSTYTYVEY